MAFHVVWTQTATLDLKEIVQYIADDDPRIAKHFGLLIIEKIEEISQFPFSGRIVPEKKMKIIREIIFSPYRLVYELNVEDEIIYVIKIWHSARGPLKIDE